MHTLPTLPSPPAAQPSQSSLRVARFPFLSPTVTFLPGRGESVPAGGSLSSKGEPLAVHTKFISLPRPLPLGEVDANAVSGRRRLGRSPQRGCFRRKPALQMPLSSTTHPVKMQCQTARRLPGIALIKIILPLNMARAKLKPFKIVRPALPQQRHIICAQRKPHVRQHTSLRQHIIAAGTAAHRASRFWLYSSMET